MYWKISILSDNNSIINNVEDAFREVVQLQSHGQVAFFTIAQLVHLQKHLLTEIPQLLFIDCKKFDNNYQSLRESILEIYEKYTGVSVVLIVSAEFERGLTNNYADFGVVNIMSLVRFGKEIHFFARNWFNNLQPATEPSLLFAPEQQFAEQVLQLAEQGDVILTPEAYDDHQALLTHLSQQLNSCWLNLKRLNPNTFVASMFGTAYNAKQHTRHCRGLLEEYQQHTMIISELLSIDAVQQAMWWQFRRSHSFNRQHSYLKHQLQLHCIYYLDPQAMPVKERPEGSIIQFPKLQDYFGQISLEMLEAELQRFYSSWGYPELRFSTTVLALLQNFPWQGGFGELRLLLLMLLERWMANPAVKPLVDVSYLPLDFINHYRILLKAQLNQQILEVPLREAKELFESQYLEAQLQRFNYNISNTAEFIQIKRQVLHKKIKELGLQLQRRPSKH